MTRMLILSMLLYPLAATGRAEEPWAPKSGPLMTRWAKDVTPRNALPEYPRPQMVRDKWLNLNGLWDYAIRPADEKQPEKFDGKILVPFPIESALSGVMQRVSETQRLWYRRTFTVPLAWGLAAGQPGPRLLLHFGAVDWETAVWVNGAAVGQHKGGYDPFTLDITDAVKPDGEQEIIVAVADPTDAGPQPRGKQVRKPEGIWYTPTTGIWQTVWLEPVPAERIENLRLTPDVDKSRLIISLGRSGGKADAVVIAGGKEIARGAGAETIEVAIPQPRLWSPDDPFLYDVRLTLRSATDPDRILDQVESYFGMRQVAIGNDDQGVPRILLNGRPLLMFGPLDQGFWPDGLYTAPTDEALRYDIETTKKLGFNLARKHVKVEPDRWYYWCDKLGLLVWQDMPNGDAHAGQDVKEIKRSPESAAQFELELKRLIDARGNHPCIVMWVPFNEGWGQYDTRRIAEWVKKYDPTRLVNNASGWNDLGAGDVNDIHDYPGPKAPPVEKDRAIVLGEFGGLGLPLAGHTWQDEKNWGYKSFPSPAELTAAYDELIAKLRPLVSAGLSAAVYTQTTDVEIEVNGLMAYDRAVIKMDAAHLAATNRSLYAPAAPTSTRPGN